MDEFDDRLPFLEAGEWWRWYPSAEEASQALATKLREARAERDRLRREIADHHTASVFPREMALRETAEALGFTHMGAQGFAGMARRHRDAAVAAEREACAALLDDRADDLDVAESYLVDVDRDEERLRVAARSKELRAQARAIRARGAGGGA